MLQAIMPAPVAAATGDPSFSSVSLLCHFDGTNGATVFTDNSHNNWALAAYAGGANTSTAQHLYGTASLVGAITTNQAGANVAGWLGAGPFTVEVAARTGSSVSGQQDAFLAQFTGGSECWWLGIKAGPLLQWYQSVDGSTLSDLHANYTFPTNTWVQLAVDRDASNVVRLYANGVVLASATITGITFHGTNLIVVGSDGFAELWPGNIDEVRITPGVCRYGGTYTPATAAFPNS